MLHPTMHPTSDPSVPTRPDPSIRPPAQRLNHLRALAHYWAAGQVDTCLAALARLRDPSVAADLLAQVRARFFGRWQK